MNLSVRQREILDFIKSFSLDKGYPPTMREIGDGVGIASTAAVTYQLNALQQNGCILRDRRVARGIRLIENAGS